MKSHRFYSSIELKENTSVELSPDAAHHCTQVLRYKPGDHLTVFNGDGFDYLATIEEIDKKRCQIKISSKKDPQNESPLKINLVQGIARGDKMDLIIQKAVELGVSEITPLFTERCNVKLEGKRLDKKLLHWNKTIISACEQSGRSIIPRLNAPISIDKLSKENSHTIYLEPNSGKKLTLLSIEESVRLLIGPEGGFSEKDLAHLNSIDCIGANIGSRILRTETAGLAVVSILQARFGDF